MIQLEGIQIEPIKTITSPKPERFVIQIKDWNEFKNIIKRRHGKINLLFWRNFGGNITVCMIQGNNRYCYEVREVRLHRIFTKLVYHDEQPKSTFTYKKGEQNEKINNVNK